MKTLPDYLYPVLPTTLVKFADQITCPLISGQSTTFIFPHFLGGERAWIRFFFDHPQAVNLQKRLPNHRLLCFDPTEIIDTSHSAFLYYLLRLLMPQAPDYTTLSQQQIIDNLHISLRQIIPDQELVIFFLKLNAFPNLTPLLGNLLYSLWRPHKRRLHFVTTLTPESVFSHLPDLLGEFSEPLAENVHYVNFLSPADIRHSITHWEHVLSRSFSLVEKSAIIKHSHGSPYISKILAQNLCQPYSNSPDRRCAQIVSHQFGALSSPQPLSIIPQKDFTPQEIAIINLFLTTPGKAVSRDMIASALWGNQIDEKYSDWAIDKFISLIRHKLQTKNCSSLIKTIKNHGYLLED